MIDRRRSARRNEPADLNITAFMNLMVILVPFLLITAVFSRMAVLELNLPSSADQSDVLPDLPQIEVVIRADRIEVGERNNGIMTGFSMAEDRRDLSALNEYLQRIKSQYPDKLDATILLEPDVSYDTLVQVMDAVRVVAPEPGVGAEPVELFPEISIGDAPTRGS